jgi:predicted TIM-barrel fold metal-dependent hydrolase
MEAIFRFSVEVLGPRIYPLISFHPGNSLEQVEDLLARAAAAGLRGVKLHPMYQDFAIDDRKMMRYYERIAQRNFFIVFHTGFDIAFPGNTNADIERVRRLAMDLPHLRIVATHTGGWRQWERVGLLADCPNVFTDISMTQTEMTDEAFLALLPAFGEDRVFFGSDSPWTDQAEMVGRVKGLALPETFKEKILHGNAESFLRAVNAAGPSS